MAFVRGSVDEVARTVGRLCERLPRAVVATGVLEIADHRALVEKLSAHLRRLGVEDEQVVVRHVGSHANDTSELQALNRARDLLLPSARLVLLTAGDEGRLRQLRALTVDLTSAVDLSFTVTRGAVHVARGDLLASLRRLAVERSAVIDLTGLLPTDTGATRLRVEEVFMDLVPVQARERRAPLLRVLVLGQPGAGKTTWLRWLASVYGREAQDPLGIGPRAPVLVPLPAFARAREERHADLPLLEFVGSWLADQGIEGAAGVADASDILLLLDGLDEVRGQDARRAVMDEIHRLDSSGAVVVSGRTLILDELTESQRRGFHLVGCRPPDNRKLRRFLGDFFRARGNPAAGREAAEAFDRILHDRELSTLARNPLLLVFLALLHELEGRIPDRRFLLYHRIAEILLDRWERTRARARGAGVPSRSLALGDTRRVVGALAWWMLDGGREDVGTAELRAELARVEVNRGATVKDAEARADALVELLQSGSALLVSAGQGRWRFVHATLGEYFAGIEFARGGPRWVEVLRDVFRPDWQEVVVFGAGELGQRGDDERLQALAEALLRPHPRGGRYSAVYPTLIGAVLREDPGFHPPTQRRMVARFLKLCFDHRYWPRSREAVAQALLETARVAPQRTWYSLFQEDLGCRFLGPVAWRPDQDVIAGVIGQVLSMAGLDSGLAIEALVQHSDEGLQLAGWRNRYQLADDEGREQVLEAARQALPQRGRYDVSRDLSHLFMDIADAAF